MKMWRKLAVVGASVGLLASACGDSGEGTSGGNTAPGATAGATTTGKQPVAGGTVTFGSYSKINGLDPIVALGHGTSGGIPLIAVYDTLVRWDPASKSYEMRIAESVTPSADNLEWTVKIKPGVKFTDGTDLDADAVRFGMNRHRVGLTTVKVPIPADKCAEYFACPRNNTSSTAYMNLVDDIQVVDKTTLKFMLNEPYTAFPFILSAEAAMIPSKTAMQKACTDPTKPAAQCTYNLAPVGAGPFMVQSYKPDDVIQMVKNPNYYRGTVYLDGINFLDKGDTGALPTWEALKAGTTQAAFLRDAQAVAAAKDAKYPGFATLNQTGTIALLNGGVLKPDGTPSTPATKDVKLRQAIQAAIDTKVINDRGYAGKLPAGGEVFQSTFPWDPKVPAPKYDPELAKRLVSEVKASGWNGNLDVLYTNSPTGQAVGQAVTTLLQAVGINATLNLQESTEQQRRVITTKEFELATWGVSVSPDDYGIFALAQNLRSDAPSNRVGFKSPAVDQALKDVRSAKTDEARRAAYKIIAEEIVKGVPFVVFGAAEEYNTFSPKLQGVVGGNRSYVYFDKAWFEK